MTTSPLEIDSAAEAPAPTRMDLRPGLAVSAAVLLAMVALTAWAWPQIPADARLPVHWNARGEVDGWGGKGEALLFAPVVCAVLTVLLAGVTRIEPRAGNLARSGKAYTAIWVVLMLFFGALHAAMVLTALGRRVDVPTVILAGIGVMFLVIGNYMGKIRSNFFCGVRTPWTLSSELSWRRTHRFARWLFVIQGLAMLVLAPLGSSPAAIGAIVAFALLGVPAMLVYSWWVWKHDPARTVSTGA